MGESASPVMSGMVSVESSFSSIGTPTLQTGMRTSTCKELSSQEIIVKVLLATQNKNKLAGITLTSYAHLDRLYRL